MVITMMGINDCGLHMPYDAISDSKAINFLRSFRTYKLTRLLWLHIITRLKGLTYDKLSGYTTQPKFLLRLNQVYKVHVGNNPKNGIDYRKLGRLYREQGKFFQAEESFKKAIELNPQDDRVYFELGWVYRDQGRLSEAEESFKKAIELNPQDDRAYVELGWVYRDQGKHFEAEESFKKAIELNPQNHRAYVELGWIYYHQGRLFEAEESFKKAIELDPLNVRAYGALKVLYIEMGNSRLAREYDKKAKESRLSHYSSMTIDNYHKLERILDKRGIAYVCVQYPMRNLEPLRKIFQGNDKGIIFIDNEKIFKDVVAKYGYQNYFNDKFGGDFGHCTKKGNRLLAKNIANVIIKEVFHK